MGVICWTRTLLRKPSFLVRCQLDLWIEFKILRITSSFASIITNTVSMHIASTYLNDCPRDKTVGDDVLFGCSDHEQWILQLIMYGGNGLSQYQINLLWHHRSWLFSVVRCPPLLISEHVHGKYVLLNDVLAHICTWTCRDKTNEHDYSQLIF